MSLLDDSIWNTLAGEAKRLSGLTLRSMFADDPCRFQNMSATAAGLTLDYSKSILDYKALQTLLQLSPRVEHLRSEMFSGVAINSTEKRSVLHVALRAPENASFSNAVGDVMPEVLSERSRCLDFAEDVRVGKITASDGKPFRHIINIGIGGSDLGPAMAVKALAPFVSKDLSFHFVSNVDGSHLCDTVSRLDPARTLILVASKTFTTLETMMNARSAREWIVEALGPDSVRLHFAAISTNIAEAEKFGIGPARVFRFWDWVGGRYSVWSAIGLSVMIAIGRENFEAFLAGAYAMDQHFRDAPASQNLPMLLGLIGVWYRNAFNFSSYAVLPYDERLSRLPAWLQQTDMESNGKSVTRSGERVAFATSPVVWGEPGTNGQHAFFQCLHQGTDIIPVDFLIAAEGIGSREQHHQVLIANCLAQSEALMRGRSLTEAVEILKAQGLSDDGVALLAPHKVFSGNRPSNTIFYRRLDPFTLGAILALYEHKVFVQGAVWGVNSFDQWGVELGKELATRLSPIVAGEAPPSGLDSSTAGIIASLRELQDGNGP